MLACGPNSADLTSCTSAIVACRFRSDGPGPLLTISRRLGKGGAWQPAGETCNPAWKPPTGAPIAPPPPVPTFGQIQEAFRRLPFAKPGVSIQPVGGKTLVNLATFYQANWPQAGLAPGEQSAVLQMLSWRVQFKIGLSSYDFHFGDGGSSGLTSSAGGTYPDGDVQHVYASGMKAAAVSVDAKLDGQYRVNGGEWMDVETIADLQNEPVTTLRVMTAKAKLYSNAG